MQSAMKKIQPDENKAILDRLIELFGQYRRWLLFFGTGTSRALDQRLGMPSLAVHLKDQMPPQAKGWSEVRSRLEANKSLEQALTGVSLPQETRLLIQKITGDFVAKCDLPLRDDILLRKKQWPGEVLIRGLVQRLPPQQPRLSVVTVNYDMLIEYSCAKNGIRYTTGYVGEILRTRSWQQAQDSFTRLKSTQRRGKTGMYCDPLPHVELHKVHGSINLFRDADGRSLIECDAWTAEPPEPLTREVAVPGDQKYQTVAEDPASSFGARMAEDNAMAFLMIGYGFNDSYLHNHILERVRHSDCPLVILSLDLPDDTITWLHGCGKRVWILTADKDVDGKPIIDRTRISYPESNITAVIESECLWSCEFFATKILGG